jgi:hypothetical protein
MRRLTEPELKMWLAKLSHDYALNSPLSSAEIAARYHQAARLEFRPQSTLCVECKSKANR